MLILNVVYVFWIFTSQIKQFHLYRSKLEEFVLKLNQTPPRSEKCKIALSFYYIIDENQAHQLIFCCEEHRAIPGTNFVGSRHVYGLRHSIYWLEDVFIVRWQCDTYLEE